MTASPRTLAVDFSRAQLNLPYVLGASGPAAWDCSGLWQGAAHASGCPDFAGFPKFTRMDAHQLWMHLPQIEPLRHPQPGDAACYGTPAHVEHIVVVTDVDDEGRVTEVVGASSKLGHVAMFHALVTGGQFLRDACHYRTGFVGLRRLPVDDG